MKPVAVIGAGITGLSGAFRLQQRGIPVVVYEGADRVGGPIQTVRRDGYLAECGPNTILETSPLISGLVEDLGLASHRLYSNPSASERYIARGGVPVPLPNSVLKFISTKLFSTSAKMRVLGEPFVMRAVPGREESVADFVVRRLGTEFLDYAINPFVAGVYAGDPRRLSVQHAFPKLHEVEQRYSSLILGQFLGSRERKRRGEVSKQSAPKFSFDTGLQLLADTLEEKLGASVRLQQSVTRVRRTAGNWKVTISTPKGSMEAEHSSVVFAVAAHQLATIRFECEGWSSLAALREIDYPPVASVTLGFRREEVKHPLDGFGVLVPEVERLSILGTIFSSSLFPNRAPVGHATLTSYVGGIRAPDRALKGTGSLVESVLADLRKLLGVTGQPSFEHVSVFRNAIPQYNVGYGRFKKLMSDAEGAAPGLYIAGHSRNGPSLSDSILSGLSTAEKIEQQLSKRHESITK